jgi:hypothetical protein
MGGGSSGELAATVKSPDLFHKGSIAQHRVFRPFPAAQLMPYSEELRTRGPKRTITNQLYYSDNLPVLRDWSPSRALISFASTKKRDLSNG